MVGAHNKTIIATLPLASCLLLNMPDDGLDCSVENENECIECPLYSQFVAGDGIDDYKSLGHIACLVMATLVVLIGSFGIIANLLIMLILKRQKSRRGFDTMLIGLAGFDLFCCVTSIIAAVSAVTYYQNWNRGIVTLYFFWLSVFSAVFGKSGSSFQTVLITFERFLKVAFPIKTNGWFTPKRSKILSFGVLLFSLSLAIPRYSSHYVGKNEVGKYMETTKDLEYIIMSTSLQKLWYIQLKGYFDRIDFWLPLPILLVLNSLVYYHVLKFNARRKELNKAERKDIRAVKMFLPVVIVLFFCNIVHYVDNISLVFYSILHKETLLADLLSYVVNSAANLPIYYYRDFSFRKETRAILFSVPAMRVCCAKFYDENGEKVTTTGGSVSPKSIDNENNSQDLNVTVKRF